MRGMVTKKQLQIARFVYHYRIENFISPTYKEIGEELGGISRPTVHHHVLEMERRGLLTYKPRISRSIRLSDTLLKLIGSIGTKHCPHCGGELYA